MPPTAKLYRYGGDESIAALHEVSLSDVKKCQQKLEQRIARYNEENEKKSSGMPLADVPCSIRKRITACRKSSSGRMACSTP